MTSKKLSPFERAVAHFGNQSKIAAALGISRQAVSIYDRRGWFSLESAEKLAKKMKVPLDDMLETWKPKNKAIKASKIRTAADRARHRPKKSVGT